MWDFAFAGADISGDLLPLHSNFTVPLVDQVNQWARYASHILPHPTEESLVAWWIGINDTGDTLKNATVCANHCLNGPLGLMVLKISNFTQFWTQEMEAYFNAVVSNSRAVLHTNRHVP